MAMVGEIGFGAGVGVGSGAFSATGIGFSRAILFDRHSSRSL
jgi:hypothetical protein